MIASGQRATPSRRCFLGAAVLLLSWSAIAGDCSPATILVNAFDRESKFQPNLQAHDLSVEVDGRKVEILSLSLDNQPRRVVLLVDSSGSMEASIQRREWGIALPAAGYALHVVPNSSSVALLTFSDKLQRQSSSFESPKAVGARVLDLKKTQPEGPTRLFDSIHRVVTDFAELHSGDAIYVVSDGGDNRSRISQETLRQELVSRGIRVFAFLIRSKEGHSLDEVVGGRQMEDLAKFTGGDVVRVSPGEIAADGRIQVDKLAPQIIGQVENVFRVQLKTSPAERTSRVKVSIVDRHRTKIDRIAYSHQIIACPPAVN